jgi:hypothetical protein
MLQMFGTAAAAAHECRVSLTALGPYSDRKLEAVARVLAFVANHDDARQARDRAALVAIVTRPMDTL